MCLSVPKPCLCFVVALAGIVMIQASVQAEVVTVVNPGFEDISGEVSSNEFTFGPLNGWDLYDPNGVTGGGAGGTYFVGTLLPTAPVFFTAGAPEGNRVGIAFNFFGSGGEGEYGLQQTLAETLQPDTRYELNVDVGNIASGTANSGTFFNLDGFPGYRIDVLAGSTVIAQDNGTLTGSIGEGLFATSTISFDSSDTPASIGDALQIRLVNLNIIDAAFPNADLEVDFDNVRFTAMAVPEPGVAAVFLLGMTTCFFRRRKESLR